jgi:hypothetical protein
MMNRGSGSVLKLDIRADNCAGSVSDGLLHDVMKLTFDLQKS